MKTPLLVGIVVAVHFVAIGSVLLFQGCGTTQLDTLPAAGPGPMPPSPSLEPPPPPPPAVVRHRLPTAPAVIEAPEHTTRYVIRKGDSVSMIANRYGLKTADVVSLNNLKNANLIRSGQTILLPGKINIDAPAPVRRQRPAPATPSARRGSEGNYVVKKGDCLSVIAHRHGVKSAELRAANGLTRDVIYVGQKLVIPGGGTPRPAQPAGARTPAVPDAPVRPPETVEVAPPAPAAAEPPPMPEVANPVVPDVAVPDAPAAPAHVIVHVVEADEDLYNIAMTYGVRVAAIKEVNGLTGSDLTPGQKLRIPVTQE